MEDLWAADPDPAVARIEGRLSNTLSTYLYHLHQQAHLHLGLPTVDPRLVQAAYRTPDLPLAKAEGQENWSKAALLFAELSAQPRGARRATDLAEALSTSWYERGVIEHETRVCVVQANLIGRIQGGATDPVRAWGAYAASDTAGFDVRALNWAQERACQYVRGLRDESRQVLAGAVTSALLRGDSPGRLAVDLTHQFGVLNRDARRLAVTEISYARSNGFLSAVPAGEDVEWFSAKDACSGCSKLHGRRFRVTSGPDDPEKCVWVGKHNVGLKSGERTPTIPLHPNCRCRWVRVRRPVAGVSRRLDDMLNAIEHLGN